MSDSTGPIDEPEGTPAPEPANLDPTAETPAPAASMPEFADGDDALEPAPTVPELVAAAAAPEPEPAVTEAAAEAAAPPPTAAAPRVLATPAAVPSGGGARWVVPVTVVVLGLVLVAAFLGSRLTANPAALFAAAAKQYAAAPSFQTEGRTTVEMAAGSNKNEMNTATTLAYAQPNLFALEQGEKEQHTRIVSDGQAVYCQLDMLKLVVKGPAAKDLKAMHDAATMSQYDILGRQVPSILNLAAGVFDVAAATITAGIDPESTWLASQAAPAGTVAMTVATADGVKSAVWVSRGPKLVEQVAVELTGEPLLKALGMQDMAGASPEMLEQFKSITLHMLVSYEKQVFGAAAPSAFAFQAPEGFESTEIKELSKDALMSAAMEKAMAGGGQEPEEKPLTGQAPSDFEAQTLDGTKVKLSSLKGKPVVLDFWATWCPPCKEELPILNKLYGALKAQGVQVVAVSTDEELQTVKDFLKENQYDFTIWWLDPETAEKVSAAYSITGIPRTLYIGQDWVIKDDATGLHPESAMVESFGKLGLDVSGVK